MSAVTRITKGSRRKPKIMSIPAHGIHIDPTVQRSLIPARVKWLADRMDLDALGVFTVSDRGSGNYVVLDGQHRLAAIERVGMGEWEVTCHVYTGLSLDQEAALFRRLNDTRKITPWDDFSKGLVEGDDECIAINTICMQHGLEVEGYGKDGKITCVLKLRQIYASKNGRPDGELLSDVLEDSISAWGHTYPGVEKNILGGLAIVHRTYGKEFDRAALVNKMAKFPGGPSGILGKAKALRDISSSSLERLVAEVMVGLYNKGRRSGKLEAL